MKPENQFINSVHAHLPPPSELYRMKNHSEYTAGVADCWYSGRGKKSKDLWIEWKFITVPVRDTTVIDLVTRPSPKTEPILTELQQEWLRERTLEGRNVVVGIGSAKGGVILWGDFEWQRQITAAEFRDRMQDRKSLASTIANFVQGVRT